MKLIVLSSILLVSYQLLYLAETAKVAKISKGKKALPVQGPASKSQKDSTCNKGRSQSPINIPWEAGQYDSSLGSSLLFSKRYYDCRKCKGRFDMENTGKTLRVDVSDAVATLTVAGFGEFELEELHFHWGSDETKGSEHQLNGTSFPAELHFVHRKKNVPLNQAIVIRNGVAVLGVLIKVGKRHPDFDNFLRYIRHVIKYDTDYEVTPFRMKSLLPSNTKNFYRYHGSLTTPPCPQSVIWTVYDTPIEISLEQLRTFHTVQAKNGQPLVDNFRPVQPLNGRSVKRSFRKSLRI